MTEEFKKDLIPEIQEVDEPRSTVNSKLSKQVNNVVN